MNYTPKVRLKKSSFGGVFIMKLTDERNFEVSELLSLLFTWIISPKWMILLYFFYELIEIIKISDKRKGSDSEQ